MKELDKLLQYAEHIEVALENGRYTITMVNDVDKYDRFFSGGNLAALVNSALSRYKNKT